MSMDLYSRFGPSIARMRQAVAEMKNSQVQTDDREISKDSVHGNEEAKVIPISAGREKGK